MKYKKYFLRSLFKGHAHHMILTTEQFFECTEVHQAILNYRRPHTPEIKSGVKQWLTRHFEGRLGDLRIIPPDLIFFLDDDQNHQNGTFCFRHKTDAMLFKLTWSNNSGT